MPRAGREDWSETRRRLEDEYFLRRHQERVERARQQAEAEARLQCLADAAGVSEEHMLRELKQLGYTGETIGLLHIVPLLEVAWADGSVSDAERALIVAEARSRGIEPGSEANRQLAWWFDMPPSSALSAGTLRVLGGLLQRRTPEERLAACRTVNASCAAVALASGGRFGFRAISAKEQRVLDWVRQELEIAGSPAIHPSS